MKVLDTTFLVDYGNEVDAVAEYLLDHADERFVVPSPVLTEYLLGTVHSSAPTDTDGALSELAWSEVVEIDESTAVIGAELADEIGHEGPNLAAVDALVAAVGRKLNAPVVAGDRDLTHEETKAVVEIEEYRD